MNFKIAFLFGIFAFSLFFIAAPDDASAQVRQRLPLRRARGEAGPAVAASVKGVLKGFSHRDYFFYIPEGRSIDISLTTDSGEPMRFDVISPKGVKIFDGETEILDELSTKGTYTIRIYRPVETRDKGTSRFQLSVFMYT